MLGATTLSIFISVYDDDDINLDDAGATGAIFPTPILLGLILPLPMQ